MKTGPVEERRFGDAIKQLCWNIIIVYENNYFINYGVRLEKIVALEKDEGWIGRVLD